MKLQATKVFKIIGDAVDKGYTTISEQGGSRSGKTYNTLIYLIIYLLTHNKTRLSIVRGTLPALKGSVLIDFEDILQRMGLWNDKTFNKTELTYKFQNGSWVEFFSVENDQKIRGRKRHILYVNEGNEIRQSEWKQLKMRTTKFAIIDYNPSFSDDHWLCELNSSKRTFHFITTYKDNPFLEQSIIDEIEDLKDSNKSLWQIYGLGLRAIVEGLIFKNYTIIDDIPERIRRRSVGIDFGFTNDPTAIISTYIDTANKALYLDEECYRTRMLNSDIISILKNKCDGAKVIADSAAPKDIEEIYLAGINIHGVKKTLIMSSINKMLEYTIYITKKSVNVIKEYRNYTYKQDRNGNWLNEPINTYNHAIDATRYVVIEELMDGKRPVKTTVKVTRQHED